MESKVVTYKINYESLGRLNSLISKYNKKSEKLGQTPLDFHVEVKSKMFPSQTDIGQMEEYRWLEVSFSGTPAKIDGWEFVGTIQHADGQNILRSVPGRPEIPESFRNVMPHCAHCEKKRYRKDSFVLRKETDCVVVFGDEEMPSSQVEYKQIGRNCLRDFLGHDPSLALAIIDIVRECNENDCGGKQMIPVNEVVYMAAAMHNLTGFNKDVARSAWSYLFPSKILKEQIRKGQAPDYKVDQKAIDLGEEALAWIKEVTPSSSFVANLKAISGMEYVTWKEATMAAWIVGAFLKEVEKIEMEKTEAQKRRDSTILAQELKLKSQHLGSVGDKIEFKGTLVSFRSVSEGQWGTTYLYKFNSNTDIVTWFTGKKLGVEIGKEYNVKGSVKAHKEYEGCKETVITRGKCEETA